MGRRISPWWLLLPVIGGLVAAVAVFVLGEGDSAAAGGAGARGWSRG